MDKRDFLRFLRMGRPFLGCGGDMFDPVWYRIGTYTQPEPGTIDRSSNDTGTNYAYDVFELESVSYIILNYKCLTNPVITVEYQEDQGIFKCQCTTSTPMVIQFTMMIKFFQTEADRLKYQEVLAM